MWHHVKKLRYHRYEYFLIQNSNIKSVFPNLFKSSNGPLNTKLKGSLHTCNIKRIWEFSKEYWIVDSITRETISKRVKGLGMVLPIKTLTPYSYWNFLVLGHSVFYDGRGISPLLLLPSFKDTLVTVKTVPRLAKFRVRWIIPQLCWRQGEKYS